jgi:hypothetical protein
MRAHHAALALLTALLVSPALAGPAAAGGPTSVLLVAPGTGRTASLYTGQADYEALSGLVGDSGNASETTKAEEHAIGNEVTATWLIHDVSVWRVDRIYLDAPGGPWIATQTSVDGSGDIWSSPVQWHNATQGKAVVGLLTRLGLLGDSAAVEPTPQAATTPTATEPAAATEPTAADRPAGPVWGLAGLALGVGLTAAAVRVAGRRRQDESEVTMSEPMDDILASTGH